MARETDQAGASPEVPADAPVPEGVPDTPPAPSATHMVVITDPWTDEFVYHFDGTPYAVTKVAVELPVEIAEALAQAAAEQGVAVSVTAQEG